MDLDGFVIIVATIWVVVWSISLSQWLLVETEMANDYCQNIGFDHWETQVGSWDDTCVKTINGSISIQPIYILRPSSSMDLFKSVSLFFGGPRKLEFSKIGVAVNAS
jgi:hypothetical protein